MCRTLMNLTFIETKKYIAFIFPLSLPIYRWIFKLSGSKSQSLSFLYYPKYGGYM